MIDLNGAKVKLLSEQGCGCSGSIMAGKHCENLAVLTKVKNILLRL